MHEHLVQLLSEGRLESTGTFTLDLDAQALKMTSIVKQEPCIFLGRLLQAATVNGARAIRYTLSKQGVKVVIAPQDGQPFARFVDHFEGKASTPCRVQRYLQMAIASGVALKPAACRWRYSAPDGGYFVDLLEGRTVHRLPGDTSLRTLQAEAVFELDWPTQMTLTERLLNLFALQRKRLSAHEFIYDRCCYAPVPVFLDGHPVHYHPYQYNRNFGKEVVPFRAVHMGLENQGQSKDRLLNAPNPTTLLALRARLNGQDFGTAVADLPALEEAFRDQCVTLLSLETTEEATIHPEPLKFSSRTLGGLAVRLAKDFAALTCLSASCRLTRENNERKLLWGEATLLNLPTCTLSSFSAAGQAPQLCCSEFLGLSWKPSPPKLIPIKDGLAIANESPTSWKSGQTAIVALPDCKADADHWRLIHEESYHQQLERLKAIFRKLESN